MSRILSSIVFIFIGEDLQTGPVQHGEKERKSVAIPIRSREYGRWICHADHVQKVGTNFADKRSVGIIRSRTQATECPCLLGYPRHKQLHENPVHSCSTLQSQMTAVPEHSRVASPLFCETEAHYSETPCSS
jgi:hypothetical protein